MLNHAASAMGICAAENSMGLSAKFPCHLVSRAIWGSPEMGSVGLSEEQAERKGYEVEVGGFPYSINGNAMLRGRSGRRCKDGCRCRHGRNPGRAHCGQQRFELIGEAVLAMQLECTVRRFAKRASRASGLLRNSRRCRARCRRVGLVPAQAGLTPWKKTSWGAVGPGVQASPAPAVNKLELICITRKQPCPPYPFASKIPIPVPRPTSLFRWRCWIWGVNTAKP